MGEGVDKINSDIFNRNKLFYIDIILKDIISINSSFHLWLILYKKVQPNNT
jgi:hypothetical protein